MFLFASAKIAECTFFLSVKDADLKLPTSYTLDVAHCSDHIQGFSTDIS